MLRIKLLQGIILYIVIYSRFPKTLNTLYEYIRNNINYIVFCTQTLLDKRNVN